MAKIGTIRKTNGFMKDRMASLQAQNILTSPSAQVQRDFRDQFEKFDQAATGSDEVEMEEARLLLDKILYGENSLLARQNEPEVAEEIRIRRQRAHEKREARLQYEADRDGYINDVMERARRKGNTEEEVVSAVERTKQMTQAVQAEMRESARSISWRINNDPKVQVNVPPKTILVKSNGMSAPRIVPWEIRFAGCKPYYVNPGTQMLPKIIADRIREILESQTGLTNYKELLKKLPEQHIATQAAAKYVGGVNG